MAAEPSLGSLRLQGPCSGTDALSATVATGAHRLKGHAHMCLAVGFALLNRQTAKPEIFGRGITHGPLARAFGQLHQRESLGLLLNFADLGQSLGTDLVGRWLRGQRLSC